MNERKKTNEKKTVIDVNKVFFSYDKTPFLKDITFQVKKGEIFGFLGPSGAGKSTLQKVLTGICTNYEGSARILGWRVRITRRISMRKSVWILSSRVCLKN